MVTYGIVTMFVPVCSHGNHDNSGNVSVCSHGNHDNSGNVPVCSHEMVGASERDHEDERPQYSSNGRGGAFQPHHHQFTQRLKEGNYYSESCWIV